MKEIKFALCLMDMDDNILSRREIKGTWTIGDERYLDEKFDVVAHNEVVNVISDILRRQITKKVIRYLMSEAVSGISYTLRKEITEKAIEKAMEGEIDGSNI